MIYEKYVIHKRVKQRNKLIKLFKANHLTPQTFYSLLHIRCWTQEWI